MQKGIIVRRGASWCLRCNEKVTENGKTVWKSRTIRLAPVGGAYRTAASVQPLADEKLAALSGSSAKPTSTEDFERFLDRSYLPHVRQTLKHATSAAVEGSSGFEYHPSPGRMSPSPSGT